MKKFRWPLQRLLDVKEKQENFARIELVAITEQIVVIRGQIMMQKTLLRNLFSELNQLDPQQRTPAQRECMEYAHVTDAKIKTLNQSLEQAEQKRKMKVEEIITLRKLRKGLDRLRAKALICYREQVNQAEQKELDESITTTFARKILMPA
ncbi:MAG: flagellar export protein FliJ [Planctomycetota bacterium]